MLKFDESLRTHNARLDDGYSRVGHIKPFERLHDGITFTHRRLQAVDVRTTDSAIEAFERSGKAGEAEKLRAAKIAANVRQWTEAGTNGEALPITPENVLALPSLLIGRMYNILAGWMESDPQEGSLPEGDTPEAMADALLAEANREASEGDAGN